MKLKSIFCGVAAAALLSACSSDEPAVNGGGVVDANKTTGYMSVAINLPTQPAGSRANDYFNDGLPEEYAVKSSYLILFTGTAGDEAHAKFHSVYDLKNLGQAWGGGNQGTVDGALDGNITVTYQKSVEVKGVDGGAYLFGLVMLNVDDVCNYITPTATTAAGFVIAGNVLNKETTFSDIQGIMTLQPFASTANGFFMTNAPLSTVAGGRKAPTGGKETTLVEIGLASEHLYPTEAEAAKAPTASFFVERAVGKVTLGKDPNASVSFGKDGITGITVESVKWILDNTKKGSYVVRNLGGNFSTYKGYAAAGVTVNPYRFVGHSEIGQTSLQPFTNLYRTYWAEVPQKNGETAVGDFNTVYNGPETAATEIKNWGEIGIDKPQYCNENTFTVDNMTYENTTRAILKVKFNAGEGADGLYIANGTMYNKLDNAASHLRKALLAPVKNAILACINKNLSGEFTKEITTETLGNFVTVVYETNVNGRYQIKSVAFDGTELNGIQWLSAPSISSEVINQINVNYGVTSYVDGISYYAVSIKHFGDDLTPWKANGNNQTTIEGAYGSGDDAAKNYLGRYGIVRNNWYDLQVTSFKKLGEPVVGNLFLGNTPDDNNEVLKYLSFRINILAWAKRSQKVEL